MGVYNRAPLEVERGRGARLWSTDGTEYLDCVAGISTNGLGHAHPVLVQAVKDQAPWLKRLGPPPKAEAARRAEQAAPAK